MNPLDPAAPTTATTPARRSGTLDQAATVLTAPLALAQRMLPASPVPVALGAGALALAGAVDWPLAGAIGLGYLALRGWRTVR
jgi:biotin transporter BioY